MARTSESFKISAQRLVRKSLRHHQAPTLAPWLPRPRARQGSLCMSECCLCTPTHPHYQYQYHFVSQFAPSLALRPNVPLSNLYQGRILFPSPVQGPSWTASANRGANKQSSTAQE